MLNDQLKEGLIEVCADAVFEDTKQFLSMTVNAEQLLSVATALRENSDLAFDYLFCLSAVDWTTYMTVVYHLNSTRHGHELVLKAKISNRQQPEVETVSHLWRTAEFHEREAFDLFGIRFLHHPDLRRILLDDDWEGYPMRKDYRDDLNIVTLG